MSSNLKMFSKVINIKIFVFSIINFNMSLSKISKLIINGELSKIEDFPHSAFLSIECNATKTEGFFACGASVVNQAILLTAAHCIFKCKTYFAAAAFGHERIDKGMLVTVFSFKLHKEYTEGSLSNDIALVLLKKSLKFSDRVSRVSLLRKPPDVSASAVAGWGIDKKSNVVSRLKYTQQHVLSYATCLFMLSIPDGTLCAENVPKGGVPSNADSGCALMINKYIQIGLVSYSNPYISETTTVYTNISHFYDWIAENSAALYCQGKRNRTV